MNKYLSYIIVFMVIIAIAGIFVGLIFSPFGWLRFLNTGGIFSSAGLRSISSDETVFVTFYTPGWKVSDKIEGGCGTFSGVNYAYRNKTTQQIINHCSLSNEDRKKYQDDANYELVSAFSNNNYAVGGIAVNHPTMWKNGAKWPIKTSDSAQVQTGTAYWLHIPGYTDQPAPVIDTFGTATNINERYYQTMLSTGKDMTKRLDLAFTGTRDEQAARSRMNCQGVDNDLYACEVSGVTVYQGNAFTGDLTQIGGNINFTNRPLQNPSSIVIPDSVTFNGKVYKGGTTKEADGFYRTFADFPRFTQHQGPWANTPYKGVNSAGQLGNTNASIVSCGANISSSGCGPTSLSNAIAYYVERGVLSTNSFNSSINQEFGGKFDPGVTAELSTRGRWRLCGSGTSGAMLNSVGSLFGLKVTSAGWQASLSALAQGKPVIALMKSGDFTSGGHYVTLFAIDNSRNIIFLADSYKRNITAAKTNIVSNNKKGLWIIEPK